MDKLEIARASNAAMYDLGRQAREAGFKLESCNVCNRIKRSWWFAGWHDLDMEKGVKRFGENNE